VALSAERPDFGYCNPACTYGARPRGWWRTPVQLYVFDLQHPGPESLLGLRYYERRARLQFTG
jgi:hypothetical protein